MWRVSAVVGWIEDLEICYGKKCSEMPSSNDQIRNRVSRLFHFEQAWTKNEECEKGDEGLGTPMFQLVEKLKLCRRELIGWSTASFGNIKAKLGELEERLKQLENNNQGQHSAQIKSLKMEASPDKLIWAASTSGKYCVKSAYYLLKDHYEEKSNCGEASNGEMMKVLWSRVWSLHIPPKVKNFIWRACLNILPTKINLKKKKITTDWFCPICKSETCGC
ncbi:putative ribonuclease h protein [Fagus crenata]